MEVSGQLHVPSTHGTHWTGEWMVPRAGLDVSEKKNLLYLPRFEPLTAHTITGLYIPTTLSRLPLKICDHKKVSLGQSCLLATSYWARCMQMAFFLLQIKVDKHSYRDTQKFAAFINTWMQILRVHPHAFQAIISQRTHVNCHRSMKCASLCLKQPRYCPPVYMGL
jgi:hypothetical protein